MSDKEYKAYLKALEAWKNREPKGKNQQIYEKWLEEKPEPPRRVRNLTYNDKQ